MYNYECKRCSYQCKQKGDMVKHLNRKKICIKSSKVYTIDDKELYDLSLCKKTNDLLESCKNTDEINNSSTEDNELKYMCDNCNTSFTTKSNLLRHQIKYCKNNINININNNINNNIYNFNINLIKSFDEEWDTSNIDHYLKSALILSSNKYSNTLRCIINNNNNLNVIYNNKQEYGLVYDKNDNKFNNIDIKDIVNLSMEKIHKHLKDFHKDIHDNLKENNLDIDNDVFDLILTKIDSKYEDFSNDSNVNNNVKNIISNIYHEKYDTTKKICKDLLNNNIEGY